MPDNDYMKFRFSVTCHCSDLAVVQSLRSLAQWAERHPYPQIGWGGSGESEWPKSGRKFVLRFTDDEYRKAFIDKGKINYCVDAGQWL